MTNLVLPAFFRRPPILFHGILLGTMKMQRRVLYSLIFLSGVSGLIYQIVWQRYLSILLGAHAKATAIVLAIFLGGLAMGYAAFGHWSRQKKYNFFKAYACIEALLGLWALLFPVFFPIAMKVTAWLYHVLGVASLATDLLISSLLIGPPTFLMGSTLPLLTQAMSRNLAEASKIHARIYGFNTLGACIGSLLAGYILIPEGSFQIALGVGAILNFTVAIGLWGFEPRAKIAEEVEEIPIGRGAHSRFYIPILVVIGFCSGFSLMTLENVLIRLMGLSAGSSYYNFTLVVSIFILCLGVGSLLLRNIKKQSESRLLWNLLVLCFTWSLLPFLIRYWPYNVHVLRASFADVGQGFYFYQILLGLYFVAVLFIPLTVAGATLPICFHLIKDSQKTLGHRVGQLYSVNTFGCVLGSVIGGYLLLYWLDLEQILKGCIFVMWGAAALSFKLYCDTFRPSPLRIFSIAVMFVVPVYVVLSVPNLPKEMWIQPFRNQEQIEATLKGEKAFREYVSRSTKMVFWKDGPNTSLGIGATPKEGTEESRSIFVNGKSDGNTRGDYFTTVMLAHIPALLSDRIGTAAVIGFGTGITIGTLASYTDIKKIDVLEISDTVIKNAFHFDAFNGAASKNEKVEFHEMDAFRYFEGVDKKFDLIVSEPSNPWVMGIENLYSREFYHLAKRKLSEGGTFAQWIHTYSFSDQILKMVLRTIHLEFPHVSVFQLKGGDLALIAREKPLDDRVFGQVLTRMAQKDIKLSLESAGVNTIESFLALEIIPEKIVPVMAEGGEVHNLTSPRLSHQAARAFFLRTSAAPITARRNAKKWNAYQGGSLLARYLGEMGLTKSALAELRYMFCDHYASKNNSLCEETVFASRFFDEKFQPLTNYADVLPARVLATIDSSIPLRRTSFRDSEISEIYSFFESYKKYISPITKIPNQVLYSRLDDCLRQVPRKRSLYGQCLLQKLLIMDSIEIDRTSFDELARGYFQWFAGVSKTDSDYLKLKEAKEILEKMIGKN